MATTRDRFDAALREGLVELRRRALCAAVDAESTLGDLLSCLDDTGYLLDDDDPVTVGDLLVGTSQGPRVVDVLDGRSLPLDCPLDGASEADLALPLAALLPAPGYG